jgi:virginiamycin B lyase
MRKSCDLYLWVRSAQGSGALANRLIGFDPKSAEFFSVTPVPSGAQTVRHMVFDAKRRAFWFGTDANTLVRANVP